MPFDESPKRSRNEKSLRKRLIPVYTSYRLSEGNCECGGKFWRDYCSTEPAACDQCGDRRRRR